MPTLIINGKRYKTKGDALGSGGQASVFRIEINGKEVAIKIINDEHSSSDAVSRFRHEIEYCQKLDNEHVIKILDGGTLLYKGNEKDSRLYYTMPIYEKSLRTTMTDTTRISITTAFSFIMQLCEAIQYIHSCDIYHRDIKPENILLNGNQLVLTDFGIAHFKNSELTTPQKWLGNKEYSAPEQRKKGNSINVGKAADIYALGCIINELFTGSNPSGTSYTQVADIYPFLSDIDLLVEICLRQNPDERPFIEQVSSQVKSIYSKYSVSKKDLISDLLEYSSLKEETLSQELIDTIIDRAADDLLTAKIIYENKTNEQLDEYEMNYNCDIHYSIDEYLAKQFFSTLVNRTCLAKFNSEGDKDPSGEFYKSLDTTSEAGKEILKSFLAAIQKNGFPNGRTLKLFTSCCDYHCKEIIATFTSLQKEVSDLLDAPILYIVLKLRYYGCTSEDFSIEEHIKINWEKTVYDFQYRQRAYLAEKNGDSTNDETDRSQQFNDDFYRLKMKPDNLPELALLNSLVATFGVVYVKSGNEYIVRFDNKDQYNYFRTTAMSKVKNDFTLEGDVLDLMTVERVYEGIVELIPWDSYMVTHTLRMIFERMKEEEE